MTLAMAWVRDRGDYEELMFCSDSRLRFGCAWDSCQKVFPLPRGDCAITFAGDTQFAYPFIHAAINAVSLHQGSKNRLVDITVVKHFLLKAINNMLGQISDLAYGKNDFDEPILRMVFGGYSWLLKRFVFWKFYFNPGEREFRHAEISEWGELGSGRRLVILGNPEASYSAVKRAERLNEQKPDPSEDIQYLAKMKFIELLDKRNIRSGSGLDMEPFEVLCDLLREEVSPHIGGSPQLVKVSQHLNAQPFGVRWPISQGGRVAVLGRILPQGEKMHVPVLDPDTLEVEQSGSKNKFKTDEDIS